MQFWRSLPKLSESINTLELSMCAYAILHKFSNTWHPLSPISDSGTASKSLKLPFFEFYRLFQTNECNKQFLCTAAAVVQSERGKPRIQNMKVRAKG